MVGCWVTVTSLPVPRGHTHGLCQGLGRPKLWSTHQSRLGRHAPYFQSLQRVALPIWDGFMWQEQHCLQRITFQDMVSHTANTCASCPVARRLLRVSLYQPSGSASPKPQDTPDYIGVLFSLCHVLSSYSCCQYSWQVCTHKKNFIIPRNSISSRTKQSLFINISAAS